MTEAESWIVIVYVAGWQEDFCVGPFPSDADAIAWATAANPQLGYETMRLFAPLASEASESPPRAGVPGKGAGPPRPLLTCTTNPLATAADKPRLQGAAQTPEKDPENAPGENLDRVSPNH